MNMLRKGLSGGLIGALLILSLVGCVRERPGGPATQEGTGGAQNTSGTASPAVSVEDGASSTMVINLTSGVDNLLAVNQALNQANTALDSGWNAIVFFNVDAAPLVTDQVDVSYQGNLPVKVQVSQIITRGGTVLVSPFALDAHGLRQDQVIDGVQISTAGQLYAELSRQEQDIVEFSY